MWDRRGYPTSLAIGHINVRYNAIGLFDDKHIHSEGISSGTAMASMEAWNRIWRVIVCCDALLSSPPSLAPIESKGTKVSKYQKEPKAMSKCRNQV
jgi:hypothetical protein